MTTTELEGLIQEAFGEVIAQHNLQVVDRREDNYGVQVTLGNSKVAVRFRWEDPDERFFLSLHRLDRGAIAPMRDLAERRRDPLNGFDVDDLISLRTPNRRMNQGSVPARDVLEQYAEVLPHIASDVLAGNFVVFEELTRVVARRIEQQMRDGQAVGPDAQIFRRAAREAGLA